MRPCLHAAVDSGQRFYLPGEEAFPIEEIRRGMAFRMVAVLITLARGTCLVLAALINSYPNSRVNVPLVLLGGNYGKNRNR